MRIDSALPFHIARAYGNPVAAVRPPVPVAAPSQGLVAGRVGGGLDLEQSSMPLTVSGAFSMYTRAADKIEAATAVAAGRIIDVQA